MMSDMESERLEYANNPKKYTEMIMQIANLKTTDNPDEFLANKRRLIKGEMTEQEYNQLYR